MTDFQKLQINFMVLVVRLLFDIARGYAYVKKEPIDQFEKDCAFVAANPGAK